MKWHLLAALLLAACAAPEDEIAAAGRAEDARFRHDAGIVYEALLIPSCRPRPGYDRAALLARESTAMAAFERGASAAARSQLDVARIDLLHRLRAGRICEDDADPARAKLYLASAKRQAGLLDELRQAAPTVAFSIPREAIDAPRAAEIRFLVRRLADLFWAPCSSPAEAEALQAPARAELARFRERLAGTRHAVNEAVASADAAFLHSITSVECSDAPPTPPAQARSAHLAAVRRQIAAIEALAGGR